MLCTGKTYFEWNNLVTWSMACSIMRMSIMAHSAALYCVDWISLSYPSNISADCSAGKYPRSL